MNTTLRDALTEQINEVGPAHLDVDELVGLGEQRLRRRRRLTAALGSAAAVVLVIALAIGGAALNRSANPGPTDTPKTDHQKMDDHNAPQAQPRPIVYTDDFELGPYWQVGTLYVGDREVEINQTLVSTRFWSPVVTDAGAVYTQDDHTVWFTDGGRPRQIAQHACAYSSGDLPGGLAAGNAGPLVAWFDCTPTSRGDLVVYDTSRGHEVARHPIPSCEEAYECMPDAVIGEHVYFGHFYSAGRLIDHHFRLDLTSDQVIPASPAMYADDLRTHPRAMVIGDSWQTGTPTANGVGFQAVGSRLVPGDPDAVPPTRAFDTATGQPVRFRLPTGYQPDPYTDIRDNSDYDSFTIFEWLDDDTVALAQRAGASSTIGDIITCRLSDGHCSLAVKEAPDGKWRIVPGQYLPG